MAEEMKKIDSEELKKVGGGMSASFQAMQHDLDEMIPAEVREKLKNAKGDVGVSKMLAENGIDVEKIEKRIEGAGLPVKKIGFQEVADEALANIAGGSARGIAIKCKCGNCDTEKMSFQIFESAISYTHCGCYTYRCEICDTYLDVFDSWIQYRGGNRALWIED